MTSQLAQSKSDMRTELLGRRDALELQWRLDASLNIAAHGDEIGFMPGTIIAGFWPMRSEVDVRPLMDILAKKGARLALPAIMSETRMKFRALVAGAPLIDMGFNTFGPDESAEEVNPDIILVPVVGFDSRGHRLGYGAGYYDRAIEKLLLIGHEPRLIGVAFECQRVERIANEGHDAPLVQIITESGLRSFPLSG